MRDERESPSLRPSSSFVYPIRSLLSDIQPAGSPSTPTESTMSLSYSEHRSGLVHSNAEQQLSVTDLASGLTTSLARSFLDSARESRVLSSGQPSTMENLTSAHDAGEPSDICPAPTRRFSDLQLFSGEESAQPLPAVFSGADTPPSSSTRAPMNGSTTTLNVAQKNLETMGSTYPSSTTMSVSIYESSSYVDADAETTTDHIGDIPSTAHMLEDDVLVLPFNPSECGFVHLSPVFASPSPQSDESSSTLISSNRHQMGNEPTTLDTRTSGPSIERRESSTQATVHSTFRFQHAQDEYGHHVIIGREGEFRRCEDEPIRTPGAVQAFGVLMAMEETENALVVQQVSENSTALLGLPPSYLFSLSCFTEALPDSSAHLLWENIRFLSDPGSASDDEEESPHVFLLTGWGEPGSALPGEKRRSRDSRRTWTCWCAMHRAGASNSKLGLGLIIMEFELERDTINPLYPPSGSASSRGLDQFSTDHEQSSQLSGNSIRRERVIDPTSPASHVEAEWVPNTEVILESTTSYSKPLPALERLRRGSRIGSMGLYRSYDQAGNIGGIGMMETFAIMSQINEQFDAAPDLDTFLKVVVGIIKDLTQFHRVLIYQFDEVWNGKVVAELVDQSQSEDLYSGLHFPASDIPAQARQLYALNKVRLLYDRTQPTARLIVKNEEDLRTPLNMTHCYIRAMSPIHLKYLENMGVRASMSLSIIVSGQLWGLVSCLAYGDRGIRVSFPVRQMLRLLSQAISRNVERLSYAERLHTKKLINSIESDRQHSGHIISNVDDLLGLFDADFGILIIGEGAKILGPDQHGQEILIVAEYLRLKQFTNIEVSQAFTVDFPDLPKLFTKLEVIAGLLYVPLSNGGKDFIAFLRRGQKHDVHWAGKPYKDSETEQRSVLEPRKSFKAWSETVVGRSRAWTAEQLETAGVLALVYGKFIEVWRNKEDAAKTKLTSLLLSNANHEVRTPLNHIINYLQMALNGALDEETRKNLTQTYTASKSLLFTINDLLDLTRLETGAETSFNESFNLHTTIWEATYLYRREAERRSIKFEVDLGNSPETLVGDARKIKTVVQNLSANAVKYTAAGSISVRCKAFEGPKKVQGDEEITLEMVVADTGCGIPTSKLQMIFREFEKVESSGSHSSEETGIGLGLAVVARNVEQLKGQLRVESEVGEGSCFTCFIPLALPGQGKSEPNARSSLPGPSASSVEVVDRDIHELLNNFSFQGAANNVPDRFATEPPGPRDAKLGNQETNVPPQSPAVADHQSPPQLRVLVVEDDLINRAILTKRLRLNGHIVVNATNGREGLAQIEADQEFDAILMDIQMPILNGFEATQRIREFEKQKTPTQSDTPQQRRLSHVLNRRIPIFAVSASLTEKQHPELLGHGMDGWILKPIDFNRLKTILQGVIDPMQRRKDVYCSGYDWENGGWLRE